MVFDNRLRVVLKAALPISTASPFRLLWWVSARRSYTFSCRIAWLASSVLLANSCSMHILHSFLHRVETGILAKLNSLCLWARSASGMVRLDNCWSCIWRTSSAIPAEEMTIVVTWPCFTLITRPWALESFVRDLWGLSPTSKRFSINGKGFGPGGSFLGIALLLKIICKAWIKSQVRQRHITPLKKFIFIYELWSPGEKSKVKNDTIQHYPSLFSFIKNKQNKATRALTRCRGGGWGRESITMGNIRAFTSVYNRKISTSVCI